MHIVKTWGAVKETVDYLEYNMYEGVRHLFGEFYFCTRIGHSLMDVSILA